MTTTITEEMLLLSFSPDLKAVSFFHAHFHSLTDLMFEIMMIKGKSAEEQKHPAQRHSSK